MKTKRLLFPSHFSLFRSRRPKGVALVLVLGVIVLVTVLMAGFMAKSRTERFAAAGYRASAEARQLGDLAVNLVQGQINHATTQGSRVAWASQPGMIRTFDTSGKLVAAYKLYSASNMISQSGDVSADISGTWKDNGAVWVDLNAPVSANGVKNYPIADPSALNDLDGVQGLGPGSSGGEKGFSIINPATRTPGLAPGVSSSSDYQILPMPARWLYVLRDGTLVAAQTGSTSNNATIPDATEDNPIVGRIAFWTDDETAKVNINTAGEGVFWDTPHGYTPTEVLQLSIKQPWNGEFNRYPGHPATVSLSAIFPVNGFNSGTLPLDSTSRSLLNQYLSLTPAYAYGGSEGGNKLLPPDADASNYGTAVLAMDKKSERLYASVDELFFQKDRTTNSLLTRKVLESRKFFLTASSRAPETNLFNLPRIAIWPVQRLTDTDWDKKTNPFDRLIAFCSSLKGPSGNDLPNFIQRTNGDSSRDLLDIPRNTQLYQYVQKLTEQSIPGFGGNFLAKYNVTGERDQILTEIFDYIRTSNLYDTLLDYKSDGVTPVAGLDSDGNPIKGVYTFTDSAGGSVEGSPGFGQANPSMGPNNTSGLGRYFTIKQLMLVFVACADEAVPLSNDVNESAGAAGGWSIPWTNPMLKEPYPSGPLVPLTAGQKRVQLMVLPELFNAMAGMNNLNPDITIEIKGMDVLRLAGNDLKMASGSGSQPCWSYFFGSSQQFSGGGLWDPEYEYKAMFVAPGKYSPAKWTKGNVVPVVPTTSNYAFVSAPVTVNGSSMSFTGGTLTVNIYSGQGISASKLLQSINIEVPNGTFPVPDLASTTDPRFWSAFNHSDSSMYTATALTGVSQYSTATSTQAASWGRPSQRYNAAPNAFPGEPIRPTSDVIRAMIPTSDLAYDYRLVSGTNNNSNPLFEKHPDWNNTGVKNASLFNNGDRAILQGGGMRLATIYPTAPYSGAGAVNVDSTGDFDVGAGGFVKGSLANKPDEGDMYRSINANWAGITPDNGTAPYFQGNRQEAAYAAYYSPNRVMPSPVMFGSLPTGVKERAPWRTLLFRPLANRELTHKGATSPHDALLLDLFWMPVVEPYAISDRLSTAGKINMNYQIVPYNYIERTAPLRAALKSERITQIPLNYAYNSKIFSGGPGATFPSSTNEFRKAINADETLKQFEERFDQADKNTNIFISPSEICQQYLIPQGTTYTTKAAMAAFWDAWRQSGDNMRERPYATIYQKLTTKSNSYTVHFRAQTLKKIKGSTVTEWAEGIDKVTGEYRGSTTLERFIDPNAKIPDYAADPAGIGSATMPTLDSYYKWRVVRNQQFAP